jgi:uncharacterized membrane protein YdjX (TVP38/TMEM64 family)
MKKTTKKILTILIILLFIIWIFFAIYFSWKGYKIEDIKNFLPKNNYIISAIFLFIFSVRIFVFIPSTMIIIAIGLLTNNFWLTFILSIIWIAIWLTQTYYIGYLLEEDLEWNKTIKKIKPQINKIKKDWFKYIFLWCLAPFFPTDLICYASGFIKYNYKKFLLAWILWELPLIFLYSFIWIKIEKYIVLFSYIFLFILIVYWVYLFLKNKKK